MSSTDEPLALDLVTASLRAERADLDAFVEGLAVKLEEAAPGAVEVDRVRSGFRGPRRVRRIAVVAADEQLELAVESGGRLTARRAKTSGGIVLKREELDVDGWLGALAEVLVRQADRDQRTRQALERLLLG